MFTLLQNIFLEKALQDLSWWLQCCIIFCSNLFLLFGLYNAMQRTQPLIQHVGSGFSAVVKTTAHLLQKNGRLRFVFLKQCRFSVVNINRKINAVWGREKHKRSDLPRTVQVSQKAKKWRTTAGWQPPACPYICEIGGSSLSIGPSVALISESLHKKYQEKKKKKKTASPCRERERE
jgi:hypothetical protein